MECGLLSDPQRYHSGRHVSVLVCTGILLCKLTLIVSMVSHNGFLGYCKCAEPIMFLTELRTVLLHVQHAYMYMYMYVCIYIPEAPLAL